MGLLTVVSGACGTVATRSAGAPTTTTGTPSTTSSSVSSTTTVAKPGSAHPPSAAPEAWTGSGALDTALTAGASNYYGGLELAANETLVLIHVLDAGQSQVERIVRETIATYPTASLPPGVVRSGPSPQLSSIRYVRATATLASLTARQGLLTHNADLLQAEGITLTEWGPNISTNTLDVGVEQTLTPSITAKIQAIVGANNLHLTGDQRPATG